MTLPEALYSLTLSAIGGGLAFAAGSDRRERRGISLFFQCSFWFRTIVVFLNNHFHFLVQKAASDITMSLLNQRGGMFELILTHQRGRFVAAGYMKFLVEALLNLPGTSLFENTQIILNLTNAFIGAICGVIAFAYLRRLFSQRAAICGLLLVSLYPAAVNFSIFALRDIIIYCLVLTNLLSFNWLVLGKTHRPTNGFVYVLSLLLLAPTRLAFVPFVLIVPAGFLINRIRHELRELQAQRRPVLLAIAVAALSINGSAAILGSYQLVIRHLGFHRTMTPTELVHDFALARAARGSPYEFKNGKLVPLSMSDDPSARQVYLASNGQGAASVYLPIETMVALPLPARAVVQVVGFMLLPYPWQLTSAPRLFALFDSAFVWLCFYGAWQTNAMFKHHAAGFETRLPPVCPSHSPPTLRLLSQLLLAGFVLAWFCFGLIVSDAGNAFRMRLSVMPFIALGASLFLAVVAETNTQRRLSTAQVQGRQPPDSRSGDTPPPLTQPPEAALNAPQS